MLSSLLKINLSILINNNSFKLHYIALVSLFQKTLTKERIGLRVKPVHSLLRTIPGKETIGCWKRRNRSNLDPAWSDPEF